MGRVTTTTIRRAVRWVAVPAILAALAGLAGCHRRPASGEAARLDFTLKDMGGHDVRLSDFRGRPLVINFWATDCAPCRVETPELADLATKYKDRGLTILGISISDTPDDIRAFAHEFSVPYPLLVGFGREDVQSALGLEQAIPMSVFVTPAGEVYGRLEGLATPAFLEKQIDALFNAPAASQGVTAGG